MRSRSKKFVRKSTKRLRSIRKKSTKRLRSIRNKSTKRLRSIRKKSRKRLRSKNIRKSLKINKRSDDGSSFRDFVNRVMRPQQSVKLPLENKTTLESQQPVENKTTLESQQSVELPVTIKTIESQQPVKLPLENKTTIESQQSVELPVTIKPTELSSTLESQQESKIEEQTIPILTNVLSATDPKFEKYNKMKQQNIPEGAIRQKMLTDKLTPQEIAIFFGETYKPSTITIKKKPSIFHLKSVKKSPYWNTIREAIKLQKITTEKYKKEYYDLKLNERSPLKKVASVKKEILKKISFNIVDADKIMSCQLAYKNLMKIFLQNRNVVISNTINTLLGNNTDVEITKKVIDIIKTIIPKTNKEFNLSSALERIKVIPENHKNNLDCTISNCMSTKDASCLTDDCDIIPIEDYDALSYNIYKVDKLIERIKYFDFMFSFTDELNSINKDIDFSNKAIEIISDNESFKQIMSIISQYLKESGIDEGLFSLTDLSILAISSTKDKKTKFISFIVDALKTLDFNFKDFFDTIVVIQPKLLNSSKMLKERLDVLSNQSTIVNDMNKYQNKSDAEYENIKTKIDECYKKIEELNQKYETLLEKYGEAPQQQDKPDNETNFVTYFQNIKNFIDEIIKEYKIQKEKDDKAQKKLEREKKSPKKNK